ncbi:MULTISPECIES: hypothetical protein [Deinococcus]|uniref:Uncharacterized protein n=1 Tax=Deinococcus rufus TaxID=2136097 RepID=A0ABV7ZCY6_9DEIO|nr:hypothetical protein [Deinococcus sp. AB2017081]WQE93628.1 hypothetical protein U2P90_09390 [Deinococcus sp. AB2017081]
MALWVLFGFIVLSATSILLLTRGPLRATPSVRPLRIVAAVQYACAIVLAGARLTGAA